MKYLFQIFVMGAFVVVLATLAFAEVPQMINYQGKLTTATGGCLNATVSMTFTIYADSLGDTTEWSETQNEVVVKDGIFSVLLGSVNPLPDTVFDGSTKYLGVQVESDPEMRPLKPMVTTGYAFRSQEADTAEYARTAPAMPDDDWVIRGDTIYHEEGNVGIGTTTPSVKLHVSDARYMDGSSTNLTTIEQLGYGAPVLRISNPNTANGNIARMLKIQVSGNYEPARGLMGMESDHYLGFITNDSEQMTITSAGNVGIGTVSPETKLDVVGDLRSTMYLTTWGNLGNGICRGILYYDHLLFEATYGYAVGDQYIQFNSGFNPGIGGPGAMAKITAYRSPSGYDTGEGNIKFSLRQGSNLSDVMAIQSNGNVGIGTTSPAYSLDVNGSGRFYSPGNLYIDGNVGIGTTSPTRNLMVSGDVDIKGTDPQEQLRVENESNDDNADGIFARTRSHNNAAGVSGDAIEETDGDTYGVMGVTKARSTRAKPEYPDESNGSAAGVYGWAAYTGNSGDVFGVLGVFDGVGGYGPGPNAAAGVYGLCTKNTGKNYGVFGETKSSNTDVAGVYGIGNNMDGRVHGVLGLTQSDEEGSAGVFGVAQASTGITYGVYGRSKSSTGWAAFFEGNVKVTGSITKGGGGFKIDHPLNPANEYLSHSFVESPDMMNIYNGNVTLGAKGEAWVELPEWFEALNRDFRYQLTAVGAPGPNLYIAQEISGNLFKIAGGREDMKVSWQVTGIRQDAYAEKHRIQLEEEKPPHERGKYLHAKELGMPETMAINH